MTLSEFFGYLSGAKRREADAALHVAYTKLMNRLDTIEGEERAREALTNLGEMMRGKPNGVAHS